ncbi:MAG: aminotransferase class V-fold PLP-dependent enzyme [Collinsella sp.]
MARREIARSFGARVRPSEIVLTNGGTEANQLALLGLAEGARQHDRKRNRVIVSAIEHDSISDNLPLHAPLALPSTWCSPAVRATLSLPPE